jgi:hypothetical protein
LNPVAPLGLVRAATGALILVRATPVLWPLHVWFLRDTAPLLGWPRPEALSAPATLALGPRVVAGLCVARTIAALLLMLGIRATAAGLAVGVCGYLVMLQDPLGSVFTLHLLYQAAVVLAITDSSTAFAVQPRPPRSPRSSLLLVRLWVSSIYLWAGLSKLRRDWLDGRTLDLLRAEGRLGGLDGLLADPRWRVALAVLVVVTELGLAGALLVRRTRRGALVVALTFHAVLEAVARPDLLGWEMMVLLLAFLDPRADQGASSEQRMAEAG